MTGYMHSIYILGIVLSISVPIIYSLHNKCDNMIYIIEGSVISTAIYFPIFSSYFFMDIYKMEHNFIAFFQFLYNSLIGILILWTTAYKYIGYIIIGVILGFFITVSLVMLTFLSLYFESADSTPITGQYVLRPDEEDVEEKERRDSLISTYSTVSTVKMDNIQITI